MNNYKTIKFEKNGDIGTVLLNRPKIHNAFNEVMISELIDCFKKINELQDVRIIILKGEGKSFCAGADLNWMKGVAGYSYEQNYHESLQLSLCFYEIYTCKKPTIAIVHGASMGGANGLLASCDFAYCDDNTTFSLSEVKIGIVPACISPYVVKRVGEYGARDLMLTGRRIKGKEAEHYKLVNKSLSADELQNHVDMIIKNLRTSGPVAMSHCKNLLYDISNKLSINEAIKSTAKVIADIRMSEEGQEGMNAFLQKRKPNWVE